MILTRWRLLLGANEVYALYSGQKKKKVNGPGGAKYFFPDKVGIFFLASSIQTATHSLQLRGH